LYSSLKIWVSAVVVAAVLTGCMTSRPAPVSERSAPARSAAAGSGSSVKPAPAGKAATGEPRSDFYTVRPGDTLYSIASEHGVDYRELALWNGLDNPGALRQGQQLRVVPPASGTLAVPSGAVTAPLKAPGGSVQAKPLGSGAAPPPAPGAAVPPAAASSTPGSVISEPKGIRLPYSDQALAQLSKPEAAPPPRIEPARPDPRPDPRPDTGGDTARGPEELDWSWPARGKVIGTFNDVTSKGIAIAGKLGQPVLASAPGRVIFSGTGIRGFGKLIVIKHNNTYLSVYAHNSELVVKEGQNVTKGQKIAEMGNSDADQVKLHFEIRRFGKPIDPMKLLPSPA
jgi:lipoprotein NlpD